MSARNERAWPNGSRRFGSPRLFRSVCRICAIGPVGRRRDDRHYAECRARRGPGLPPLGPRARQSRQHLGLPPPRCCPVYSALNGKPRSPPPQVAVSEGQLARATQRGRETYGLGRWPMYVDANSSEHDGHRSEQQQTSPETSMLKSRSRRAGYRLRDALSGLREAIRDGNLETLCAAYHIFRTAANGHEVRDLHRVASEALGLDLHRTIVDAYASRGCFMCRGGFDPCDHCEGRGVLEGDRKCDHCGGLGGDLCDFCAGTGWADRETIPADIRPVVARRQFQRVCEQMQQLARGAVVVSGEQTSARSVRDRCKLARAAVRVQARVRDLVRLGLVQDEPKRRQLLGAVDALVKRIAGARN